MSDQVALRVGGLIYAGWTSINLSTSMEATAGDFEVEVSERWLETGKGGQPLEQLRPIRPGDRCEVTLGGTLVCTGQVERLRRAYGAQSHSVTISGRSLTGNLVDSSVEKEQQIRGKKLEEVARLLCQPFGIGVTTEVDTGEPIPEFHAKTGETVHAEVQRLCALRSLLVSDGPGGDLVITAAGAGRGAGAIHAGHAAIKSGDVSFDFAQRHSRITVKGQQPLGGLQDGAQVALIEGEAADPEVTQHRPLVIHARGRVTPDLCRQRAEHEQRRRQGRAREVNYTMQGWRDGDGKLWWKGQRRRVVDPLLGIDEEFIVKSVRFAIAGEGMVTSLVLVDPAAYATDHAAGPAAAGGIALDEEEEQ